MDYEPFPPTRIQQWIMPKPVAELMRFSLRDRWEVTRRHPYYLRFREYASEPDGETADKGFTTSRKRLARFILGLIGIRHAYPPPDSAPELLGEKALAGIWDEGAIAPQTHRSLLNMLIMDLPPTTAKWAGTALFHRSTLGEQDVFGLYDLLEHVGESDLAGLDQFSTRHLLAVNPLASKSLLKKSFDAYVTRVKKEAKIADTRRRGEKTADYLAVWDLSLIHI